MNISLNHITGLQFNGITPNNSQVNIGISNDSVIPFTRPMELLLMGLAGCSSVDVISILQKQRQVIEDYSVTVHATRQKHIPAIFDTITLTFHLKGQIIPAYALKAINLSVNKYCSVGAILGATATITSHIILNNQEL